jgi:sterol desaturase/sphingolipid hydroxylase (fatty acid hydroxylase superfamily)
MHPVEHLIY